MPSRRRASASGAVTLGLCVVSSSRYRQPASRRARSANGRKGSPGAWRVQKMYVRGRAAPAPVSFTGWVKQPRGWGTRRGRIQAASSALVSGGKGCYAELARAALAYSPLLLFLDPGVEACLENCRSRPWEPHKYASKREQDERLAFLLDWVRDYDARDGDLSRAAHERLFGAYDGPKQRVTTTVDVARVDDLIGTRKA